MRLKTLTAVVASLFLIAGCATIMDGGDQQLNFTSSPSGAIVTINGQEVGTTPLTIDWDRGSDDLRVGFSADGYESFDTVISSGMNNWWLGNLITGGPFGTTTDFVTGAIYEYSPGQFRADLSPLSAAARALWNQEVNTVHLALTHLPEFSADLRDGKGEYLDAVLASIANSEMAHKPGVDELRELLAESATPGHFADRFLASVRQ